jgi:dephospho-CoA kinase
MKVIGVTGNIGAGKSFICKKLEELGAYIYPMDDHVKLLQETDPWVIMEMKQLFGDDIYTDEKYPCLKREIIAGKYSMTLL